MSGSIETASLAEVESNHDSGQSSLFDYGEQDDPKSYIAVVSQPNDTGILDVVDEWIPELGMPDRKLNEFRSLREGYNTQDPVEAHNKAYVKCDLDSAFEAHVEFNEEASEAINRIADRVEHGEDIVLVCFEQSPKRCHRHKLQELIEKEIQRSTDTSEHTRAATSYAEFAE